MGFVQVENMIRSRFTLGLVLKQRQMRSPFSFFKPLLLFALDNEMKGMRKANFHLINAVSGPKGYYVPLLSNVKMIL